MYLSLYGDIRRTVEKMYVLLPLCLALALLMSVSNPLFMLQNYLSCLINLHSFFFKTINFFFSTAQNIIVLRVVVVLASNNQRP